MPQLRRWNIQVLEVDKSSRSGIPELWSCAAAQCSIPGHLRRGDKGFETKLAEERIFSVK